VVNPLSIILNSGDKITMTNTNNTQQQSSSSINRDYIPISQDDIDKIQKAESLQKEFHDSSIRHNYDIEPTAQELSYHRLGIEKKHRNALSYASAHLGDQIDFTDPKHRVFLAASLVAQSLKNFKDLDYDFRARISIANALTYSRLSKQQRDTFVKGALTAAAAGTGLAAVWAKHPYVTIPAGSAAIILQALAANKSITLAQLNKTEAEDLFQPMIIKEKNINTLNSLRKTISNVKLSSEARQHLINLVQDQQIKQLTNKVATSRANHSGSSSQDATDKLTNQRAAAAQLQRDYLTGIDSDSSHLLSIQAIGNIIKETENPDILKACQKTLDDERTCVAQNKPVSPCEVNVNVFKNIVDALCSSAEGENLSAVCQDPKIRELLNHLTQELSTQHQACDYIGELAKQSNVQNTLTTTMSNLGDDLGCAVQAADSFTDLMRTDSPDLSVVDLSFQQIRQSLHQAQQTMRRAEESSKKQTEETNNAHMAALANVVFEQTTTIATEGFEAQAHIARLKAELQQLKTSEPNNKMGILRKSQALKNSVDQAKTKYLKAQHVINNIGMGVDLLTGVISLVDPKAAKGIAVVAGAGLTIASAIVAMSSTGMALGPMGAIAGAVLGVVQYFLSGPDPMEVIMQQLAQISQQIQSLREHADERFDRLENMLSGLHRNIMREFVRLHGKVDRIKTTVERMRLEADRRDFEQQKNLAFSYHQTHPYVPNKDEMSQAVRRRCYSTFKAWALRGSKRPVFVGEFEDEMSAEDIITYVEAHGVENSLKLLADYATLHYDLDTKTVINPLIWSEGVRTLLSFVRCTPEFKQQSSQADGVQSMIQVGKTLRSFFWQLKSSDQLFMGLFKAYRQTVEELIELVFDEIKSAKQSKDYLDITQKTTVDKLKVKMAGRILNTMVVSGPCIVTGSEDKTAKIWDAQTGQCLKTLSGHTGCIWSVAYSPDNHHIVTGSEDRTAKVWNTLTGRCLKTLSGHTDAIRSVNYSPENQRIVTGSRDYTARIWNAQTGRCLKTLSGHTGNILSVAYSPDNHHIVTGSTDKTAKIWHAQKGQCLKTLSGHTNFVLSATYSPDNQRIVTGSGDQTARIWDAQTGRCLKTLSGHTDFVRSVTYSPDNQRIVTGSDDRTAKIWHAQTGCCLKTLSGHTGYVWSVAYSPDNQRIMTGSADDTAKLWNTLTGQCLRTFSEHKNVVYSVAYSHGKEAVLRYNDTSRHWSLPIKETSAKQITRLKENSQIPDTLTQFLAVYVNNDYRNKLQAQLRTSKQFQKQLSILETHRQLLLAYLKLTFPLRYNHDLEFRAAITEQLWGIEKVNALLSETLKDPDQYSVIRIKRDLLKSIDQFEQRVLTHVIQAQQYTKRDSTPCHPLVDYTLKLLTAYLAIVQRKKAQPSTNLYVFVNQVMQKAMIELAGQRPLKAMQIYNEGITDLLKMKVTLNLSEKDITPVLARFSAGLMACVNAPVHQFDSTQSHNTQKQTKPSTRKANITKATISLNEKTVTVYDCNVKGDGACALYAMSAGALLPVVDDDSAFNQRFTDLFGNQASSARSEVRKLINNYRRNPDPSELCPDSSGLCPRAFKRLVNTALRTRVANYIEKNKAVKPTGSIETYAELLVNGQQDRYKEEWAEGVKKRTTLPKLSFDVMLNKLKTHWDEWSGTPAIMAASEILQIPTHQYQYQKFKKNQPVGLTEGLEHVPQKCIKHAVPITLFFNGIDHYHVLLQPQFLKLGQTSSKQRSQSSRVNSVKGTHFNPIKTNDTTYAQESAKTSAQRQ
jgi:WD40 repeat protein